MQEFVLEQLSDGSHTATLNLDEPLSVLPSHPYVHVVLDHPLAGPPGGLIEESDESNNSAGFRKYTLGVIVHGLTLGSVPPAWVFEMEEDLLALGYDAVIPVDWAIISHEFRSGVPQEFGLELADAVESSASAFSPTIADAVDVHWIAHSRGNVVISQSLLAWADNPDLFPAIERGSLKVTSLDPHPSKNRNPEQMSVNRLNPLGIVLAQFTRLFNATANDPDVVLPPGLATHTELYYQRTEWYQLSAREVYFDYLVNYWGEAPLDGFSAEDSYDITQWRLSHFEVPNYYMDVVLAGVNMKPAPVSAPAPTPSVQTQDQHRLQRNRK